MKRWLILAALVVAISGMAPLVVQFLPTTGSSGDDPPFPVGPKNAGPEPVAVIEGEPKFEFGSKAQHEEFERDWTIWNKGKADLILSRPASSCSCTVANFAGEDVEQIVVKPNDSTKIHMKFTTKEFNGEYYKYATIPTNDPLKPRLELGAHGVVQPCLVLFPPERTVGYGSIANDTVHSNKFALSSPDKPDFKILKINSSKPGYIEAHVFPLADEDKKQLKLDTGYRIQVDIMPGMPLGPFRDELVIETDHPKQREMHLTLWGKVVGPISLIPDHLIMHKVNGQQGGKGDVIVMVRGLRPTKVEVVKKPGMLRTEVEPVEPGGKGGKYRLTVIVPPGTPSAEIDDMIELKTDHPQAAAVKVPITIYIDQCPSSAVR